MRAQNGAGTVYANGAATAFWMFATKPRPTLDLNGDVAGDVFTYNVATGAWARQLSLVGGGFSQSVGAWDPGAPVPAPLGAAVDITTSSEA